MATQVCVHACPSHDIELDIEIPFIKRGPSYQSAFIVMQAEQSTRGSSVEEQQSASGVADLVIYRRKAPVIVIETKAVVPVTIETVKPTDMIEMLIYCLYITRISVCVCVSVYVHFGLHDFFKFRRCFHHQYYSRFIELSLTVITNLTFRLPLQI